LRFDYFYGSEAEQFAFFRIPKALMTDPVYAGLSIEAKFLYGLLLDRMGMSRKNKWLDENDRVYIIYSINEISEALNISEKLVMKYMKELEEGHLLEKKKRGFGYPSLLYVRNFIDKPEGKVSPADDEKDILSESSDDEFDDTEEEFVDEMPETVTSGDVVLGSSANAEEDEKTPSFAPKVHGMKQKTPENVSENTENDASEASEINRTSQMVTSRTSQMVTSRTSQMGTSGTYQMGTSYNNTNINNNNINNTILSYPIITEPREVRDEMGWDKETHTESQNGESAEEYCARLEACRELIKDNIEYDNLIFDKPHSKEFYDGLVELILDTVMSNKKRITIAGNDIPTEVVKSKLLKLDSEHIKYVEHCMDNTTTDIRNIKQYLLSTLYNAPATMSSYYQAWVNRDNAKYNMTNG